MPGADIAETDLTGARLRKVRLSGARMRMVDVSDAVLRDVDLSGTSIDGAEIDGLSINGVEVAPLIEAELNRREPARGLRRSSDPADLREAWEQIEDAWEGTYARIDGQPSLAEKSVEDEWSLTETLRHLVLATDIWLGAALGAEPRYHPWGLPFSGFEEFVPAGGAAFGLDLNASPPYGEVLVVRRERVAMVRAFLADATPEALAVEVDGPPWMQGERVSLLRCLRVVLNEELEHRRFVERDLALLTGGLAAGAGAL
jgi:hypothetical protein